MQSTKSRQELTRKQNAHKMPMPAVDTNSRSFQHSWACLVPYLGTPTRAGWADMGGCQRRKQGSGMARYAAESYSTGFGAVLKIQMFGLLNVVSSEKAETSEK